MCVESFAANESGDKEPLGWLTDFGPVSELLRMVLTGVTLNARTGVL